MRLKCSTQKGKDTLIRISKYCLSKISKLAGWTAHVLLLLTAKGQITCDDGRNHVFKWVQIQTLHNACVWVKGAFERDAKGMSHVGSPHAQSSHWQDCYIASYCKQVFKCDWGKWLLVRVFVTPVTFKFTFHFGIPTYMDILTQVIVVPDNNHTNQGSRMSRSSSHCVRGRRPLQTRLYYSRTYK